MTTEATKAEGFADLLPLFAVRTAPGEYDITDSDGRVLWHMEGASLAEWVCATVKSATEMREQRDDLSDEMERCHEMLNRRDGIEPGWTSMEPLEDRLKTLLDESAAALSREREARERADTKIAHAAIKKLDTGIVYVGKRHPDCIRVMSECGIPWPVTRGTVDGFVTDAGRFVDRVEALRIAEAAGQVREKHAPKDELMSEDIY